MALWSRLALAVCLLGCSEAGDSMSPPQAPDIPPDKLLPDLSPIEIEAWCDWIEAVREQRRPACPKLYEPYIVMHAECQRLDLALCESVPFEEVVRCVDGYDGLCVPLPSVPLDAGVIPPELQGCVVGDKPCTQADYAPCNYVGPCLGPHP
jgi:hypothetical protein